MKLGIAGRGALVTGGSAGLGFGTARALVEEGANIVICGRDEVRLERAVAELNGVGSGAATGIVGDLSIPEEPARIVAAAVRALGRVSILVANAGGPAAGSILDLEEEAWQRAYQLTLMSAVRLTREVLPSMIEARWGRIIYITSSTAKQPIDGLLLSNVFRPGVTGLAKTLAGEYGPQGITINSVCPGPFATDRITELMEIRARKAGITVDEETRRYLSSVPAGRLGQPIELGRAIAFLASEQGAYISGVALSVDGGSLRGIHG